jgi:hypothetical protein
MRPIPAPRRRVGPTFAAAPARPHARRAPETLSKGRISKAVRGGGRGVGAPRHSVAHARGPYGVRPCGPRKHKSF